MSLGTPIQKPGVCWKCGAGPGKLWRVTTEWGNRVYDMVLRIKSYEYFCQRCRPRRKK